ncbi:3-hydroxyacyl-CoA dehydrogenase [Microvirga sp. P5_D2]
MPEVAIIGAGLIGRSWSVVFARSGWSVHLMDVDEKRLSEARTCLPSMFASEDGSGESQFARIRFTLSMAEAVSDAQLVQECGPENVEMKQSLFRELDALARPETILASSSSAIAASRFTEDLRHRERCLVAHPLNPPHLAPLVEICGAPWTSPAVVSEARRIYDSVGQAPIVINREVEGFVLNRLQAALLTEALRLVEDGVVSAQDLDKTVTEGLGLRWSFLGPLATIELNAPGGIPDYLARYGPTFRRIAADPPPPEVWDECNTAKVVASWGPSPSLDQIAARGAWRDQRLKALREHKNAQNVYNKG